MTPSRSNPHGSVSIFPVGVRDRAKTVLNLGFNLSLLAVCGVVLFNAADQASRQSVMHHAQVVEGGLNDGTIRYFERAMSLTFTEGPLAGQTVRVYSDMTSHLKPGDCVEAAIYEGRLSGKQRVEGTMISKAPEIACQEATKTSGIKP
jgi:hypothetical protein